MRENRIYDLAIEKVATDEEIRIAKYCNNKCVVDELPYLVSNYGRCWSVDEDLFGRTFLLELKPYYVNGDPYVGTTKKLGRMVASTFLDIPENKSKIFYKDGDHKNIVASNLEWVPMGRKRKDTLREPYLIDIYDIYGNFVKTVTKEELIEESKAPSSSIYNSIYSGYIFRKKYILKKHK